MAAKGTAAKAEVTQKILETFDGAFVYDKEIRVPMIEDGVEVQIKVTLTCAKTNVEKDGDTAIPGAVTSNSGGTGCINFEDSNPETIAERTKPTEEEKNNVEAMLKALGMI
jgi:hypothetical protein